MIRLLLIFLCFFICTSAGLGQNLTLKQLLKFRQMEQRIITRKLIKKGWTFMIDNKPTSEMMGRTIWAFKPVEAGNAESGAEAWCVLYYSPKSSSRILYNSFGESVMNKMIKEIKRKSMTAISNGNQLRGISSLSSYADFADNTFVFRVMTYESPNRFGIKIFDKADFIKAKEANRL